MKKPGSDLVQGRKKGKYYLMSILSEGLEDVIAQPS